MPFPRKGRGERSSLVVKGAFGFAALLLAHAAHAIQPFVVRDIRIEGAQRTEPGTVFCYLPVKVGDQLDEGLPSAGLILDDEDVHKGGPASPAAVL